MKRGLLTLFVAAAVLLSAGCAVPRGNLDHMTMIRVAGLDREDGNYLLTVTAVEPGGTAGAEKPVAVCFQSMAPTIGEAMERLYAYSDEPPFWGFASYFILGESAGDALIELTTTLLTNRDVRLDAELLVLDAGSAGEMMAASVEKGLFLSQKLEALRFGAPRNSTTRLTNLLKTAVRLTRTPDGVALPILQAHTGPGSIDTETEDGPMWFTLGGLALFSGGRYAGRLDEGESVVFNGLLAAGARWENGELIFSAAEETVGTARRVYEALKRADADCLDVAERIRLSTGAFPEDWKLVPVVMEVKP
ncbi:MAG: hypothetical protein KIG36_02925 [Eubacteriales bacterium]|nr:hypothetical protein [Eubacteriales bacterium]